MDELQASYSNAVTTWRLLRTTHPALSAPHLVAPGTAYAATRTRLMIVGQETLGWGENCDVGQPAAELVEVLKEWYRAFDLGAKYRSTPFWNAADQLFRRLNPESLSRSFIWSNLVKMDSGGRRPPPTVEDSIAGLSLLQAEIAALAPHVVIFFTGPRYDARLLSSFPGAQLERRSKTVCAVVHPTLPQRTFRTYHPRYLRMSRQWSALDEIASYCKVT